jgi:hypothetical protein
MSLTLASDKITFTDSTSLSSGIVSASQLATGAIQESFGQASGAFNFRNKFINGNFDIWQRGTSFNIANSITYTADRWLVTYSGIGATRVISRQPFTAGQTDVPGEPTYFLRFDQTIAGINSAANRIGQRIESVRSLANKQVTISFYAKISTPATILIGGFQNFGTGGSPSTETTTASANVTTNWQKFVCNITIPPINGKTIGPDDTLRMFFGLPVNQVFTFDLAQVQMEEGLVATPFEQRPTGLELSLCRRYFEKSYSTFVSPGSATPQGITLTPANNTNVAITRPFLTEKRVPPTISFWDAAGNSSRVSAWNSSFVRSDNISQTQPIPSELVGTQSFVLRNSDNITDSRAMGIQWTADAETYN